MLKKDKAAIRNRYSKKQREAMRAVMLEKIKKLKKRRKELKDA